MEKSDYPEGSITVLDFVDAVRLRPTMYIGNTGAKGGIVLMNGIANEILTRYPETKINFAISKEEEISISFLVREKEISDFVSLFDKHFPYNSSIFFLVIATALSNHFELSVDIADKHFSRKYIDGKVIAKENRIDQAGDDIVTITCRFTLSSLIISFPLSDMWRFLQHTNQLACLFPLAKVTIDDYRGEKPVSLSFQRPDGLVDLMMENYRHNKWVSSENEMRLHFSGIANDISYQVLIDDKCKLFHNQNIKAFFNGELCHPDCSHITAVIDAISEVSLELKKANPKFTGTRYPEAVSSLNIYVSIYADKDDSRIEFDFKESTWYQFTSKKIHKTIKEVTVQKLKEACSTDQNLQIVLANLKN